jgi:F0F1-type ATP synthase assembly protein I
VAVTADLPDPQRPYLAARRLAFGVVLGQAAVTVLATLAGWALGGAHAGLSAALGGAIGTIASLGMALLVFARRSAASAARILGMFYAGELVKVALAIVCFILVLKLAGASPGPMFAAYLGTFIVYWVVLARMALPALTGTRRAGA